MALPDITKWETPLLWKSHQCCHDLLGKAFSGSLIRKKRKVCFLTDLQYNNNSSYLKNASHFTESFVMFQLNICFLAEETEAWRINEPCPRSHSHVAELGLDGSTPAL